MTRIAAGTRATQFALLAGNFAIGCGVMVVAGSLNDLTRSLGTSVALGGQLITAAAVMMGVGAPVLAAALAGWDRRTLLVMSLAWYAAGHLLAALMPSFAALLPVRALSVLGAAVFTPQAAAAISAMLPPAERGRAIAFIFLGWSVASVLGMPMHSYIGESFGWRWAFALVALLSAVAAVAVHRTMPAGVRPPSLSRQDWQHVLTHPLLMGVVLVTVLSGAGQFTLFSYFAPYYRQVLQVDAATVSALFFWFGAFGLVGNLLLARWIDRLGPATCVTAMLVAMALSMAAWPLAAGAWSMAVVLVPWALGCFSSNSAQQARLGVAAPDLAPALMALNTSAIYLGQAIGAAGGGALMATAGYAPLPWASLAWMAAAIALSAWLARRMGHAPRR